MSNQTLHQRITQDITSALKAKDQLKVKVLRYIKSSLDSTAKDKKSDLTDDEALRVLQQKIKQSEDAIEKFRAGKRDDLATTEEQEVALIKQYMPEEMSEQELQQVAKEVMTETGASSPKDFGRVMGMTMKKVGTRASGDSVKKVVERLLSS